MLLKGATHALVYTNRPEKLKQTGVYAMVEVCFGPGDENAIAQILYAKQEGSEQVGFTLPAFEVSEKGKSRKCAIFKGRIAEDLIIFASLAMERIKKMQGSVKAGRVFRVSKNGVEEVTKEPKK